MTSLIRNLKNERKLNKYKFKKEGKLLCTQESTDITEAIFTKFPMDIALIKRASNKKMINTRLKKAQKDYFDKNTGSVGGVKIIKDSSINSFHKLFNQVK